MICEEMRIKLRIKMVMEDILRRPYFFGVISQHDGTSHIWRYVEK